MAGGPVRELAGGVEMPVLGLGVWQMAAGRETEQSIEWAFEAGYRHIDTAAYYRNERSVGAALARSGLPRDQVFVTTKWMPMVRSVSSELDRSLERLGLGFVDLYLIHWPVPFRASHGWPELQRLRERGLARAVGVSNYGVSRLGKLVGDAGPAVNQVQFSPVHFRRSLLEFCDRHGVALEAYSPLERGRVDHPVIARIAARLDRTPAQVMLRWSVQHGAIVIPKSVHRERIRENARIFDFELGAEDMRALDGLDRTGGSEKAR
jgi:diketogulonate reductase-like aldo/keto reductase